MADTDSVTLAASGSAVDTPRHHHNQCQTAAIPNRSNA
jgi:hypothetical protein